MKILIAYATKGGAAKECAEALAKEIGDCTVCDLDGSAPNVADFDIVVLGTGIRMGGAYKPFKKFIDANAAELLTKNVAFFFCCIVMKEFDKMISKNVPAELRNAAFRIGAFGGKPVFGGKKAKDWMLRDEVAAFAGAVKEKK